MCRGFVLLIMVLLRVKEGHIMQQEKIGCLLKELRKERGLTQEQVAELFGVTDRTVSRWENGKNIPDISVLVEISDYYEVSIMELIEGERNDEKMNEQRYEELKGMANYVDEQKLIDLRKLQCTDIVSTICCFVSCVMLGVFSETKKRGFLLLSLVLLGSAMATLSWNILSVTGIIDALHNRKKQWMIYLELILLVIVAISLGWDFCILCNGIF